jgi:hypothetical protein
MNDEFRRHSIAQEANLLSDEIKRAEAEARNGLLQFDYACNVIIDAIKKVKDGN